jgi:2-haloacid dehalogenase
MSLGEFLSPHMTTQKRYNPVIVLDVGKVLVNLNPTVVLKELSKRYGREIGLPRSLDLDKLFSPIYVGACSWGNILQELNRALGISVEPGEWEELWCQILRGEVPGMREVLAELKGKFRLVALTNTDEVHWSYLRRNYPIFKLLDGWVASYKEGVVKPHPVIYQTVVDRYCHGRLPFFYTDDILRYVEAARHLGWDAEVFSDAAQFREEIEKRLANYPKKPI